MWTQRALLNSAKQGDVDAIAFLFNLTLNKQNQSVSVLRQGGKFELFVTAPFCPAHSTMTRWIIGALFSLNVPGLETATIYGKVPQDDFPSWQQTVRFSQDIALVKYLSHQSDLACAGYVAPPLMLLSKSEESFSIQLDLSRYCFVRNRFVLRSTLDLPSNPITQLVCSFSELHDKDKLKALASLQNDPTRAEYEIKDVPSDAADNWLASLSSLNDSDLAQSLIWLSRYCLDPTLSLSQLEQGVSLTAPELFPRSATSLDSSLVKEPTKKTALTDEQLRAQLTNAQGAVAFSQMNGCAYFLLGGMLLFLLLGVGWAGLDYKQSCMSDSRYRDYHCEEFTMEDHPVAIVAGGGLLFIPLMVWLRPD